MKTALNFFGGRVFTMIVIGINISNGVMIAFNLREVPERFYVALAYIMLAGFVALNSYWQAQCTKLQAMLVIQRPDR